MYSVLRYWLPLAIVITASSGLVYIASQQILRISANDPQIQISEDAANQLSHGKNPQAFISSEPIDIAISLSPYIIVFDRQGQVLAANARLNGQTPIPPPGVFEYTRTHQQDRITWQPQPGVRSAVVMTAYDGLNSGFVLAGRSLREVEKREDQLMFHVASVWIFTMLISLVVSFILAQKNSRKIK